MAVRAPVRWRSRCRYDRNALIVADLSNDTSYAEQFFDLPAGDRASRSPPTSWAISRG